MVTHIQRYITPGYSPYRIVHPSPYQVGSPEGFIFSLFQLYNYTDHNL